MLEPTNVYIWTIVSAVFIVVLYLKLSSSSPLSLRQSTPGMRDDPAKVQETPDSALAQLVQPYDIFLVLDVEGTCEQGSGFDYPNEIIEFPVCLMKWKDKQRRELVVIDEFRSFVRPSWRPTLTRFCEELTGITQSQVDNAPYFPRVLESVFEFLIEHGVLEGSSGKPLQRFCWCSDGPYDVRDFVVKQCFISEISIPTWLRGDILDVNRLVTDIIIMQNYRGRKMKAMLARNHPRRPSMNISSQLRALELPAFEGRKHSGIDDARNISRIVSECARRNICLKPNTHINPNRRWGWMGKPGQVVLPE
ncbi:ribonuclease H-like domain-containing protein [Rhodocollybia butyracea]|uniref:Ribonuclease H-like domain-containing protein n=1 Tax=Rhodocollybia butyracea TaxID=206335 RepID=A0A9P5PL22_9AGAR|nr:ribonuclease H-like domain-containing protein [Rhodocollybia butyracea]